jgi:hypothetical protein
VVATARTTVHNPLANNDAPDAGAAALVARRRHYEMTPGPRERLSLTVKSRGQVDA